MKLARKYSEESMECFSYLLSYSKPLQNLMAQENRLLAPSRVWWLVLATSWLVIWAWDTYQITE